MESGIVFTAKGQYWSRKQAGWKQTKRQLRQKLSEIGLDSKAVDNAISLLAQLVICLGYHLVDIYLLPYQLSIEWKKTGNCRFNWWGVHEVVGLEIACIGISIEN